MCWILLAQVVAHVAVRSRSEWLLLLVRVVSCLEWILSYACISFEWDLNFGFFRDGDLVEACIRAGRWWGRGPPELDNVRIVEDLSWAQRVKVLCADERAGSVTYHIRRRKLMDSPMVAWSCQRWVHLVAALLRVDRKLSQVQIDGCTCHLKAILNLLARVDMVKNLQATHWIHRNQNWSNPTSSSCRRLQSRLQVQRSMSCTCLKSWNSSQ